MTTDQIKEGTDRAKEYTSPDNRGRCGFCGKEEEGGYAKQDKNGKWQAACWSCVKPAHTATQPKRKKIGIVYEGVDADIVLAIDGKIHGQRIPNKTKAPGMSPSTHRPKVN